MNKRWLCFILVAIVSFDLSGCTRSFSARTVDEIKKQFKSLKAYQCDVRVSITNNKSTAEYSMKHYYKGPGRYRIEVTAPEELKGQTTIYNGKSAYVFHPGINQYLVTENFTDSIDHDVFAGAFLERFESGSKADGKPRFVKDKVGEKNYFVMEFDIENGNQYRQKEKIWFDVQTATPWKTEIYDRDGKVRTLVYYDSFEINPKLDDKLFEIPATK